MRPVVKLSVIFLLVAAVAFGAAPASTKLAPANVPQVDIPYKQFTLKNGLTLIVHEDHKAPIVAVNIWYHTGSKNEKAGKTGFAHLFEHLMFNGSEHFNTDYFKALEKVGATDLNGTTNEDRTNFFQNVPVSAVDMVLWLESDRMGHLLPAIDKAKLDEQRGVVQNEKRQGENQPYAISEELITKAVWPAAHPYAHTVIGSMEDLDAASIPDVQEWFKTYYGPSNAVLIIAGDIDADTARQKVEKYFGDIPPGPPVAHFNSWIARRTGTQREVAQDRVPQARLYEVWNVPGHGTQDGAYLDLLSDILNSDKASRLYKRLVDPCRSDGAGGDLVPGDGVLTELLGAHGASWQLGGGVADAPEGEEQGNQRYDHRCRRTARTASLQHLGPPAVVHAASRSGRSLPTTTTGRALRYPAPILSNPERRRFFAPP